MCKPQLDQGEATNVEIIAVRGEFFETVPQFRGQKKTFVRVPATAVQAERMLRGDPPEFRG